MLGHEHITANQQDFKSLLTKAKSTAPDAVFFGGNDVDRRRLLRRQMGDVGMTATPFMGGDGISDGDVFVKAPARDGEERVLQLRGARRRETALGASVRRGLQGAFQGPSLGAYSANAYSPPR